MERFTALIGFVAILLIAFGISTNRRAIKWKPVVWGLVLQILVAILVLKGEPIANALSVIALPLERWGAAVIFIVLAIVFALIAKRMPPQARRGLWAAFGVVTLYLFLTYNLLRFIFET